MISGRWGKPSEVLLDITVADDGEVHGVVNPGRENAPIRRGRFDAASGTVELEGEYAARDGTAIPFHVAGRLDGRALRLAYRFGELCGDVDVVRVEEYAPPPLTLRDRLQPFIDAVQRWVSARSRPSGRTNARRLSERGESPDTITFRDAVASDIPSLADLHVTTWNATYHTTQGPSIATRTAQWNQVFAREHRRDFVLVLEDSTGRLVGFTWGKPHGGEFEGEVSKIYLRWEYHGLGLGRRMMAETARRFLARGIRSCILFAEPSNPTIGFYDRLGGERLLDERGRFTGAFGWRDVRRLLCVLAIASSAVACAPQPYDLREGISYDPAIGYRGSLDLYEPKGDSMRADRPAVVAIHGGAWRGGDKAWGEQFARELCPSGYVVVAIEYRLADDAPWPAQIEDVQKALRYLRANAAGLRIDPTRIATLGMSAGGHLATMAALRDDPAGPDGRVRVAVNLDGEHDMTMPPAQVMADFDDILTDVMGHPAPWTSAELRDISTVTFARPDVSLLTIHGAGDDNVYVAQGERITAALREKGADVELVRIEGDEGDCHEDCWKVPAARRALHRFLARTLAPAGAP